MAAAAGGWPLHSHTEAQVVAAEAAEVAADAQSSLTTATSTAAAGAGTGGGGAHGFELPNHDNPFGDMAGANAPGGQDDLF